MLASFWGAPNPNGWYVLLALTVGLFEVVNRLMDTAGFRNRMMQEIGALKAKDVEQQALIERLEQKLDAAESDAMTQRELKHICVQELHAATLVIQLYRTTYRKLEDDTIDLQRLVDFSKDPRFGPLGVNSP